jgi:Domain of unknown function (DUF362)
VTKLQRRVLLGGVGLAGLGLAGLGANAFGLRRRLLGKLANLTQFESFTATPPMPPQDAALDKATLHVARGGHPAANVDDVMNALGGVGKAVGDADVVLIKVAAQWWEQGMTNVAAVKRCIEHVLEQADFASSGKEVIVFENTHFRLADGSGLSRAWVAASERNVDVEGFTSMGDLRRHFADRKAPVSFVGLVDAGPSKLSGDGWRDPEHRYGTYGGDGRGPIAAGDARDGYHWDFGTVFSLERSWVDEARAPLTWPRFTSPATGRVIDFRDGVFRRTEGKLQASDETIRWINMTTCNEHAATGLTAACKSTMGIVDMSAGMMGTHPKARDYRSVHYFGMGAPRAMWRMGGPLAQFASLVRAPDLILTVAEWVAFTPEGELDDDIRHHQRATMRKRTVIAGRDPVAIDAWACRHLLHDVPSIHRRERFDLENPDSSVSKFLRYYRQVRGRGALQADLATVA